MQCKCGDEAVLVKHEVKTLAKAVEWDGRVLEDDLPVIIRQHKCRCGRIELESVRCKQRSPISEASSS